MASFLINGSASLSADEVHALNAAAFSATEFEPFVAWMIDEQVLNLVIAGGFVEAGPSCRPSVGKVGYRLTPKGWTQFNLERSCKVRSTGAEAQPAA